MEGASGELQKRMNAHMDAARRLRRALGLYPDCRRALDRCLRLHIARAATLASEISAGAGQKPAPAVVMT
jgi:hypothetical protein